MQVYEADQPEDIRLAIVDGEVALVAKPGVLSRRAYLGLVLALDPVTCVEKFPNGDQHLKKTG